MTPDGRIAIEDLLMAYTRFGDGGRLEQMAALFAPDGRLEVGDVTSTGPAEILAFFASTGDRFRSVEGFLPAAHHVSSRWVEAVGPDEARSGSRFLFVAATGPDHWGTYRDVVRRVDGAWRIAHRSVRTTGFAAGSPLGPRV